MKLVTCCLTVLVSKTGRFVDYELVTANVRSLFDAVFEEIEPAVAANNNFANGGDGVDSNVNSCEGAWARVVALILIARKVSKNSVLSSQSEV